MKNRIYKMFTTAAILLCGVAFISSCKKDTDDTNNSASQQAYFSNNVTNRDLLIVYAKDNNADVTDKFTGYTVRLADTASTAGTITVWNDLFSVKGTWTIDANYDKISFVLPVNVITDLELMNKQWQFTSRESATIKIAATNGEADELNFAKK